MQTIPSWIYCTVAPLFVLDFRGFNATAGPFVGERTVFYTFKDIRMNISLTEELEQFVAEKVKSGSYSSATEVISEGLRLLRERDELRRIRMERLRLEVMLGTEQVWAGRGEKYAGAEALADEIKSRGRRRARLRGERLS